MNILEIRRLEIECAKRFFGPSYQAELDSERLRSGHAIAHRALAARALREATSFPDEVKDEVMNAMKGHSAGL